MRVRAIRPGYYNLIRYKPEQIFEMEDSVYMPRDKHGNVYKDSDGNAAVCSWVEALEDEEPVRANKPKPSPKHEPKTSPKSEPTSNSEVI